MPPAPVLRLIAMFLAALGLAGCGSWGVKGQHQLKLEAPATVAVGAVYRFRVQVTDLNGTPKDACYGWMIDWPEARGILHSGISSEVQEMTVKGGAGKATLRLYLEDEKGRTAQVDRFEFKVE
jgi:hypothetical protein